MNHKRILILTAEYGFGHRSVANAITAAMEERYGNDVQVIVENPLEDKRVPFFMRDSQSDYDRWVREVPELYRLGFAASDSRVPTALVESTLVVMFGEVLHDLVKRVKPDVILSTYPFYQAPLVSLFLQHSRHLPVYTIITDLATIHRLWFNPKMDGCLVSNGTVADLAMAYGFDPAKVHITGIPVHPNLVRENRDKADIRRELGWDPSLTTILAVGSKRVEHMMDSLNVINHFGTPLQLAVVAGKDEERYAELQAVEWHIPCHIYDYVENMSPLLHASDVILCKAGGLITTESLACGLPMILIDVIPGQESGNAEFVVSNGAGDLAEDPVQILEILAHLFAKQGEGLRLRSQNACQLGQPYAAYTAADILWKAAHQNSTSDRPRRGLRRLLGSLPFPRK